MSGKDRQVNSIVLLEGQVRWIMERETPEERLAAWETLAAIAFPENPYELPYKPPQTPIDGSRLSPCDRARRDTYNMVADFINSRMWEQDSRGKNLNNVMDGKQEEVISHWKCESSSSSSVDYEDENEEPTLEAPIEGNSEPIQKEEKQEQRITMTPLDMTVEERDFFSNGFKKINRNLSEIDKQKIKVWNKKIPNAAALREWLDRSYFMPNKKLVCSEQFCAFAYQKIAREGNWISYKTNHVINNLLTTIHWLAIDFEKKTREIKRAEEEEKRKDMESEFETKTMVASQMTNEEIADMQRMSSRKAEREAMEKILRGEL